MDERANPIDVEKYLTNVHFPASKNDLINYARDHKASWSIISALNILPERSFNDASDAARETYFPDEESLRGRDSCED